MFYIYLIDFSKFRFANSYVFAHIYYSLLCNKPQKTIYKINIIENVKLRRNSKSETRKKKRLVIGLFIFIL